MRPATPQELKRLISDKEVSLPAPFRRFVHDGRLHARVQSPTACYLDLAEFVVNVEGGGWLVHFLSDQQWVMHWLLYCDTRGGQAVVASYVPFGFRDDDVAHDRLDLDGGQAGVVAESFAEFVYRLWIENEIWFRLSFPDAEPALTPEQIEYVSHYRS